MNITWVLEEIAFADGHQRLAAAAQAAGHTVVWWEDAWLEGAPAPGLPDCFAVFQGSLGCAARVSNELGWRPGAYCNVKAFQCTAW